MLVVLDDGRSASCGSIVVLSEGTIEIIDNLSVETQHIQPLGCNVGILDAFDLILLACVGEELSIITF